MPDTTLYGLIQFFFYQERLGIMICAAISVVYGLNVSYCIRH